MRFLRLVLLLLVIGVLMVGANVPEAAADVGTSAQIIYSYDDLLPDAQFVSTESLEEGGYRSTYYSPADDLTQQLIWGT